MKRKTTQSLSRSTQVSLVLADDHPLFRQGLRDVITGDKRFSILDEAGDGERALELIQRLKPRLAVLDIDMPKKSGLEVAAEVMKSKLETGVIVLTMHDDAEHFEKALECGVLGYVLKDSAAGDIVHCIESVVAGKSYVSSTLSHHLIKKHDKAKAGLAAKLGLSSLTPTEHKILKMISESKSTKEIADKLYISTKTVSAHRANTCEKLNLHGTNALLKFALEHKQQL
jgi:DNA-binding NarL/FixJ family response regulator